MTRPSSLRVLHVASGDLWGGAEAAVYELCRGLHQRGVEVQAVILNPGELATRLTTMGIATTVLNEQRQSSWRIGLKLRQTVKTFRPHIIHSHRKKEHVLACAVVRTLSGMKPALVKTIHGAPEPVKLPPTLKAQFTQKLDHWCERQFAARIAVSADLAELLRAQDANLPLTVVHNGIRPPADAIHPRVPGKPWVVGFAGRFVPIKRLDILLDVAAHIRAQAGADIHFQIVGAGPLHDALRAQASAAGLDDTVTFVPFQPNIWATLAGWDAAMLTSDHEGLPMICLEALSAGIPVFARKVGGLSELVRSPEQGALVDSADPAEIAAALLWFKAAREAHAARHSLLPEAFTAEAMCASYAAVYQAVGG
jgi:glycosyltransferase involved in cell wall biosynthesis